MGVLLRVARATMTNQLARVAPAAYVRWTGQTGRGAAAEEGVSDIAGYFEACVDEYFQRLGVPTSDVSAFLAGKTLLEYGPGDLPGAAALMIAHGADKVICVDRFPLVRLSKKNARVIARLVDALRGDAKERLRSCLLDPGDPSAGFDPRRIEYVVRPGGLSGLKDAADLVYSRAVLEHVNDLGATFQDMARAMRPGALAIHLVDLRSHGLHRAHALDFLAWSETLWRLMYSEKGVPNRLRVDAYRRVLADQPVTIEQLEATRCATLAEVAAVRPQLAPPFRDVSDEDLRWLGFWLVFRKQAPA